MIVGLDATPLVGPLTGIGRYVAELSRAVAALPDPPQQVFVRFSKPSPLVIDLPAGSRLVRRAVPARLLLPLWRRTGLPTLEQLAGRVDVFHGGNYLLPPRRRAGTVLTIHDLAGVRYPDTLQGSTTDLLTDLPARAQRADVIVTPTMAVADEVESEYGVAPQRIRVIPHGVDPHWWSATPLSQARRDAIAVPERYLLFVGTTEPRKNLAGLVRAYASARAERPELAELVIVGARGWGPQVDQTPGVRTIGYVDDGDLRGLVAGSLALCSPSFYEGFGLPVLEGLATGTRVIASDIAAHREVGAGLAQLVDPRDQDAWSQALLDAGDAADPTADQRATRRAATTANSWSACAQAHLTAYEEVARR